MIVNRQIYLQWDWEPSDIHYKKKNTVRKNPNEKKGQGGGGRNRERKREDRAIQEALTEIDYFHFIFNGFLSSK